MKTMKWMEHHIVRLAAGNLAALILLIGLPAVALTHAAGAWSTELAEMAALVGVHVLLLATQVATTGTPIPRKWIAAAFALLPVLDAMATLSNIEAGHAGWAAAGLLLTLFAAYVTVAMVRELWKSPSPPSAAPIMRRVPRAPQEFPLPADEELAL
jgi:hypothetical protein